MTRSHEEVVALHHDYYTGTQSLAHLGRHLGISREAVRQLFERHDLPRRTQSERAQLEREAKQQTAQAQRDRIIELYKIYGTIDRVAREVELPKHLISPIVDEIPNREAYRRRGTVPTYSRQELISDLQRAARIKGEPLTIPAYREASRELGLAAYDSVVRHFFLEDPDQPWQAALDAAGVKRHAARGKYKGTFTFDDCVDAVVAFLQDQDERSYSAYQEWVKDEPGLPSGPSVRNIVGWNLAVELALDKLARDMS